LCKYTLWHSHNDRIT